MKQEKKSIAENFAEMKGAILALADMRFENDAQFKEVRKFMEETLVDLVGADKAILEDLSMKNLRDVFQYADCVYDIEKNVRDITKVVTACVDKKIRDYTLMSKHQHNEEYWFWGFEEDGEEEIKHLDTYKSVTQTSRFMYSCEKDLELSKYKLEKNSDIIKYKAS